MPRSLQTFSWVIVAGGLMIGVTGCVEDNFSESYGGDPYAGVEGAEAEVRDVNADLERQEAAMR